MQLLSVSTASIVFSAHATSGRPCIFSQPQSTSASHMRADDDSLLSGGWLVQRHADELKTEIAISAINKKKKKLYKKVEKKEFIGGMEKTAIKYSYFSAESCRNYGPVTCPLGPALSLVGYLPTY